VGAGHCGSKRVGQRPNKSVLAEYRGTQPAPKILGVAAAERPPYAAPVRSESLIESKIESSARTSLVTDCGTRSGPSDKEKRRSPSAARANLNKPKTWRDRGRYEAELAERLGKDGWDILSAFPDEVEALCFRQRDATLDDEAIALLKARYLESKSRDQQQPQLHQRVDK
jgi:hypothetical protein